MKPLLLATVLAGTLAAPLRAAEPESPPEVEPWTRATACIQSDAPAIRAKGDATVGDARRVLHAGDG